MIRPAVAMLVFGAVVCLASWVGLAVGAGNVGLQQSLDLDPLAFLTRYPVAVGLSLGAAMLVAFAFARLRRTSARFALAGAIAVLAGDIACSFIVAPLLVGELGPEHGFIVLPALSLYGTQIVAAWAGAVLGGQDRVRPAVTRRSLTT